VSENYTVTFREVGRDKRTWTNRLRQLPTEAVLEKLVRQNSSLMSSTIECVFDEDLEHGVVIVGGFREVGSFRVLPDNRETPT
jgi:hypothetical protein